MTRYVVGFAFTKRGAGVLLIRKNRPAWQAGRLNGIGGHIEEGETPEQAMAREFREETGVEADGPWELFCVLGGDDVNYTAGGGAFRVYFFRSICTKEPTSPTDESVAFHSVELTEHALPNLHWLIPLANDRCRRDWPYRVHERAVISEAP